MKTLYKKTSLGQTQIWRQEISEDGKSFRTVTGKLDGKMVYSEWTLCVPKNVGRANATTAQQQCLLEVESNYKKKLAQGNYKETLDDESLSKDNFFKPMLAKKFGDDYLPTDDDYKKGIVFSQPKLDGIRCIVTKNGMFSRQGKPIISAPHVLKELSFAFEKNSELVLDGELYTHKLSNDFNKIISLARQTKPTKEDLEESAKHIQYHVYDIPSMSGSFHKRYKALEALTMAYKALSVSPGTQDTIVLVPAVRIDSRDVLDSLYAEYMAEGYEGQMVRISNKEYENKRSKQLLKRKEFKDEEFEIVDIIEGIGNRSGIAGSILCKTKTGKTFGAGIKGSWDFSRELLKDKEVYIGTLATVQYQELTPDEQVPRFGVAVKFLKEKSRTI